MKRLLVLMTILVGAPALAQSEPSAKEVLAAYCFGALSAQTQFIESVAQRKCGNDERCRGQIDPKQIHDLIERQKTQLFAYLGARGDPKRPILSTAVAEGADDSTKCVWSDIKNKVGCPAFCARRSDLDQAQCRSTCEQREGAPRDCAAAEKCADLSWISP
jgi:hypothetical protein